MEPPAISEIQATIASKINGINPFLLVNVLRAFIDPAEGNDLRKVPFTKKQIIWALAAQGLRDEKDFEITVKSLLKREGQLFYLTDIAFGLAFVADLNFRFQV